MVSLVFKVSLRHIHTLKFQINMWHFYSILEQTNISHLNDHSYFHVIAFSRGLSFYITHIIYRKVASSNTSCLEAHAGFF